MTTIPTRRSILLAATCAVATMAAGLAHADGDDYRDHYRARRALAEGRARPLAEVLERVRNRLGGEVVGVEFEREDGRYVYEFKVVTPTGLLREVYVDAETAEILTSGDE